MASAFEKVVRSVVRELDHKELTPVDSLRSSASFQPYSLLSRKPLSSRFWRPRYMCVNLSIRDILEPDMPEPALECGGTFQFQDTMDGQLQGSVKLAAPGQGRLSGGAAVSGSSSASMDLCTLRVAPNTWEAMHHERRLRQPEPKTLQQLRSRGDDVFVVTEVLQTQKEVEVTRTHKQEGSGQFALPGALCLQGKGEGHLSRKKMVTIPSGSTLAFRAAQLVIGSDWDILLFPDKKQRTFPLLQAGCRPSSSADGHPCSCFSFASIRALSDYFQFQSDGSMEHWLATTDDFQGLRAEVEAWAMGLEGLSKGPCGQLLGGLGQVLWDEPALQALEESGLPALLTPTPPGAPTWSRCLPALITPTPPECPQLEQGLCGGQVEPQDGPVGTILESLVLPSGRLEAELAGPVFYLLQALAALSEAQHVLLAKVLETGALLGTFQLVESLVEQSSPWQERQAVSLPPECLGDSWGSEAPAWALLEACGLEPQVRVCGEERRPPGLSRGPWASLGTERW
ncbi:gasdermin-D isoform 2-T2 [Dama dama]|uniref:gasdermin-D isoform X2 n=1 Tax=Dama dama TaxID=30532 RepID=UPI002A36A1AE|nr:gasdermin-D isoform X2 [Dama dama]